jgi:hypothetical protein
MARPRLPQEELRLKEVKVRFTAGEFENLLSAMDKCGHDSPSAFLRVSGIRSTVPAKIFVPEINKDLMSQISYVINEVKDELLVRDSGELREVASQLSSVISLMRKLNNAFITAVKLREEKE